MYVNRTSNLVSRHADQLRFETLENRWLLASDLAWSSPESFRVGACPSGIAADDLNGDGNLDLAVTNDGCQPAGGGDVSVLMGRGDGTFEAQQRYSGYSKPRAIQIGDVNADQNPDLVMAAIDGGTVYVLINQGDKGESMFVVLQQNAFDSPFQVPLTTRTRMRMTFLSVGIQCQPYSPARTM